MHQPPIVYVNKQNSRESLSPSCVIKDIKREKEEEQEEKEEKDKKKNVRSTDRGSAVLFREANVMSDQLRAPITSARWRPKEIE